MTPGGGGDDSQSGSDGGDVPGGPPRSVIAGSLAAAAPDVTDDEEHRRRKEMVRQRLLGDGPPTMRIGRFVLLNLVGRGAMSVVYAAYDEALDRRIAVKVLRAPLAFRNARLRREAMAMAQLAHPNVVAVHEIGHWEGRLFIAMELIKGQTVEAWLNARWRPWKDVVEVFLQAGRGLAAAHERGLVHRDFKPANVMVGEDGRVRVLDFGLVRLAEECADGLPLGGGGGERGDADDAAAALEVSPAGSGELTASGASLGTPAYMAPEQRAGDADVRSDQYSFCVALHEALFGERPGASAAGSRTRRGSVVPARLARAIERGLAETPAARWPSMALLLAELERIRWPARRWRLRAAVLGMAALVGVVALSATHLVAGARRDRAALEQQAEQQRELAHDAKLVMAAQRLLERDPTLAVAALAEVRQPGKASGWRSTATALLLQPMSRSVARDLETTCVGVELDREGGLAIVTLMSGDVQVRRTDGTGKPLQLSAVPGTQVRASADRRWVLTWKPGDPAVTRVRTDNSERAAIGVPGAAVAAAGFEGEESDVITVAQDGVARRWRAGHAKVIGAPPRELAAALRDQPGWSLSLGPAGRHVVAASPEGERWLWRVGGAPPTVRLPAGERRIFRVTFSHDERWLALTLEGGDVELWNLEAGSPPMTLHGHTQTVAMVDFNNDGSRLATASHDGTARIWPTTSAAEPLVLRGHTEPITSIRFEPSGARVVTASQDRTARVWRVDGSSDVMVLRGHAHHVTYAAFSGDGNRLATCSREPALRLWDVSRRPMKILGRHDGRIWAAQLDPMGKRLVTAGLDGTARIFQLDGKEPPIVLRGHREPELYAARWSPDGSRIATGGADGTARIWRADGIGDPIVLDGHYGWVYGMAFSPDGRWLATGSKDGEVRLSATDGTAERRQLEYGSGKRYGAWVHSVLFHPSGDRLVIDAGGAARRTELVWLGDDRRVELGKPRDERVVLAIGPDGRIATGEKNGTVRIWSADGTGPQTSLAGHAAEISTLAFSRDGHRLLSGSFDGSARIWDLERGGAPKILRGHEGWILDAELDRDETRVVTASADGTARVWNLDEPDQPIVLRGHQADVRYAGFTPEGRVVTASFDSTVRLWNLDEVAADATELMDQLHHATTVCLTADQRMQYLDEPGDEAGARYTDCERAAGRTP